MCPPCVPLLYDGCFNDFLGGLRVLSEQSERARNKAFVSREAAKDAKKGLHQQLSKLRASV